MQSPAGGSESASSVSALSPRHLFVGYSRADAAFASSLVNLLRRGGLDIWFDEERMRGGRAVREQLLTAIRHSAAGLFLVSEAWLQSDYCQWEAEVFHEQHQKAQPIIPLLRIRRQASELPHFFIRPTSLEWFEREPTEDLFWLVHCSLCDKDPGPRTTWESEGRKALGPEGTRHAGRPVRPKANPVEDASHRARLGYARAALRCDRAPQWHEIEVHAQLPRHEVLFVQGAQDEAPELFLQSVEHCFPESPPRLIVSVPWNMGSPPNTRGEFRDALAKALPWPEPTLEHALREWLWDRNLVLVHRPILHGTLEEDALEDYYIGLLPSLLPETKGARGFLKAVQAVAWASRNPAMALLARAARRLGLSQSPWINQALEQGRVERFLQRMEGLADARLPVFSLSPLKPITPEDVERWSRLLEPGRDRAAVVREILRGAKTSADILARAARQFGPREETETA
jgi:hypothetical protein